MPLPSLLQAWSDRPSVRGAAVVSEDGLLVHSLLPSDADAEAVAALAVTLVREGRQFAAARGTADLHRMVLDLAGGPAILAPIDERHTLVLLARPDQDVGSLLFEIRQSRAALSQAI